MIVVTSMRVAHTTRHDHGDSGLEAGEVLGGTTHHADTLGQVTPGLCLREDSGRTPVQGTAVYAATDPGGDLRPYLRAPAAANNAGMTAADAPDAEERQWLTHINQRQGPGGHVHMVTEDQPIRPVEPVPGQLPPGHEIPESAQQLGPDIRAVLGSLTRHVAKLESDNDRLRRDNDRLRAQVKRLQSQMQAIGSQVHALGGQVARQVGELLASTGD
jgi:hypothetical protein